MIKLTQTPPVFNNFGLNPLDIPDDLRALLEECDLTLDEPVSASSPCTVIEFDLVREAAAII